MSTDVLRKWERRYGLLRPARTAGNRRLYSRADEARVRLMVRYVRSRVPPAQAAELAVAARFVLAPTTGGDADADAAVAAQVRLELLDALKRFDETAAEQVLEKLAASASQVAVVRDVLLPLMREVGELWADAQLSVAQEHFATACVHSRLLGLARGWDRGLGPRAVLACAPGEQHCLGLIAFGIALHVTGWGITYLGADTPVGMVKEAAMVVNPRLVVLSETMRGRLQKSADELRRLGRRWPLAIGGAGVDAAVATAAGARQLTGDPVTAAARLLP